MRLMLLHRWNGTGFVVLPGSKQQSFAIKASCDAASIRRAAKGREHWTTVILQLLCCGVEKGWWGRDAVLHMLSNAHSPNEIFRVRVWAGKDDRANFEKHVRQMVKQLLELQDTGIEVDLIMPMPPKIIRMGAAETDATIPDSRAHWAPRHAQQEAM